MSADDNNPKGLDGTPSSRPTFEQAASGETPAPLTEGPAISDGPKTPALTLEMRGPDGDALRKDLALEAFQKKHAEDTLRQYNEAYKQHKTIELDRDFDKARE